MEEDLIQQIKLLKNIKPRQEWLESRRNLLLAQIRQETSFYELKPSPLILFLKPAIVLAVIFLMLVGGTAAAWVSRGSVPGDLFYPFKITLERVERVLSFPEEKKVKLETDFAGRRLEELEKIVGDSIEKPEDPEQKEKAARAVKNFKRDFSLVQDRVRKVTEKPTFNAVAVAQVVTEEVEKYEEILEDTNEKLPEPLKEEIKEEIDEALVSTEETATQALTVIVENSFTREGFEEKLVSRIEERIKKVENLEGAGELLEEVRALLEERDYGGALRALKAIEGVVESLESP